MRLKNNFLLDIPGYSAGRLNITCQRRVFFLSSFLSCSSSCIPDSLYFSYHLPISLGVILRYDSWLFTSPLTTHTPINTILLFLSSYKFVEVLSLFFNTTISCKPISSSLTTIVSSLVTLLYDLWSCSAKLPVTHLNITLTLASAKTLEGLPIAYKVKWKLLHKVFGAFHELIPTYLS